MFMLNSAAYLANSSQGEGHNLTYGSFKLIKNTKFDSNQVLTDCAMSCRSFPGMFTKGKGKRRFPAVSLVPAKRPKPVEVPFYLLPKQCEKTPKEQDQLVHLQAGLGRRTVCLDESTTHDEVSRFHRYIFVIVVL